MPSQNTTDSRSDTEVIIGRTTILILCGLLFWLFFIGDAGSVTAKLSLFGGVAGIIGYLGLLFSGRQNAPSGSVTS